MVMMIMVDDLVIIIIIMTKKEEEEEAAVKMADHCHNCETHQQTHQRRPHGQVILHPL